MSPASTIDGHNATRSSNQCHVMNKATQEIILDGAKRGVDRIRTRASFSLHKQAASLLKNENPCVAVLTGFPIRTENGNVVFENDGPLGAAMIAAALSAIGWKACLVTDKIAEPIFVELLKAMPRGTEHPVEMLYLGNGGKSVGEVKRCLKKINVNQLISIERPGAAQDHEYYNMKGEVISSVIVSADSLVTNVPWVTAAYADGGNEIGMGNIGVSHIAKHIENGRQIASRTKVKYLTLCGVSNWGAYGLLSYLCVGRSDLRSTIFNYLNVGFDKKLFAAAKRGGAVDGVTRRQTRTVDNMPLEQHHRKIESFRQLADRFVGSSALIRASQTVRHQSI